MVDFMSYRPVRILLGSLLGLSISYSCLHAQENSSAQSEAQVEGEETDSGEDEEPDEIETDRDSFAPSTTSAGRSRFIFETSHSFIDNRNVPETNSFPETLLRYGAGDRLEFRLGWNYEVGGAGNPISGNVPDDLSDETKLERESRLLYGFKLICTEQSDNVPASALILQGFTPTRGEAAKTEMSTTYVLGWRFQNEWSIDSAMRYSTGSLEQDDFNLWSPSTVLKIPVGERWKIHAEYFGVFSDKREEETVQHFFSPGAHFLINPNLELGVRLGCGLNDQSPDFFTNTGLGYRF